MPSIEDGFTICDMPVVTNHFINAPTVAGDTAVLRLPQRDLSRHCFKTEPSNISMLETLFLVCMSVISLIV
jgi:hypothetical protein